jgi:hypothetical protein
MIIEFVGLPGSGKSYYAKRYVEQLESPVLTRESIAQTSLDIGRKLTSIWELKKIIFIFLFVSLLNSSLNIKKTYALFLGVISTLKLYMYIVANKDKKFVLDEGVHQRILSILKFNNYFYNDRLFIYIVNILPQSILPNYLFYIDIPVKTAIEQATLRGAGLPYRFLGVGERRLNCIYNRQHDAVDYMALHYVNHFFVDFARHTSCKAVFVPRQ